MLQKMDTLFCIPHAGGTASAYYQWKKLLPPSIRLCPIETSGKGARMGEPFPADFTHAVEDLYMQVQNSLPGVRRYALFGHSMGGLLAYEVAYMLQERGMPPPWHVFLSGHMPPDRRPSVHLAHLPKQEFLKELFALGGLPIVLMENPELQEVFLPILYEDFRIYEEYRYMSHTEPLHCNLSIMYGQDDHSLYIQQLVEWNRYTTGNCEFHCYSGGHFYLQEHYEAVMDEINLVLCER